MPGPASPKWQGMHPNSFQGIFPFPTPIFQFEPIHNPKGGKGSDLVMKNNLLLREFIIQTILPGFNCLHSLSQIILSVPTYLIIALNGQGKLHVRTHGANHRKSFACYNHVKINHPPWCTSGSFQRHLDHVPSKIHWRVELIPSLPLSAPDSK